MVHAAGRGPVPEADSPTPGRYGEPWRRANGFSAPDHGERFRRRWLRGCFRASEYSRTRRAPALVKLISALRRVRVEAMIMMRLRFFASSSGSAEMPSSSGISISSTATSGLTRSSWLTASRPVRSRPPPPCPARRRSSGTAAPDHDGVVDHHDPQRFCCVELEVGTLVNATLITHRLRLWPRY